MYLELGEKYMRQAIRVEAVELLVAFKSFFRHEELSSVLNIPPSVLSRYHLGHMVPNTETAEKMVRTFLSDNLVKRYVSRALMKLKGDIFSFLKNQRNLEVVSAYISRKLIDQYGIEELGKYSIVTIPDYSVSLASSIAKRLGLNMTILDPVVSTSVQKLSSVPSLEKASNVIAVISLLCQDTAAEITSKIFGAGASLRTIASILKAEIPESVISDFRKSGITVLSVLP
jgi:hypothetical protein